MKINCNSNLSHSKTQHSLVGKASMDLFRKEDLNELAMRLVDRYNPDRFDAMAIRIFAQKGEPVIVIYAVDTYKMEGGNYPQERLPVKKFKLRIPSLNFFKTSSVSILPLVPVHMTSRICS
jgi:hypothetical protein